MNVAWEHGKAIFSVRDTGVGIAPEHHWRVFERLYRVNRARGGSARGSGVGLALAKWILEKHGTGLLLESAVGKVTLFQF